MGLVADVLGRVPLMPGGPSSSYATLLRPFHTSSASTGAPGFHMGWQMQPMNRAGKEATCTRSTNGCGSLGGANSVWGAYHSLSVAETEERHIAVSKDGAKRAVPEAGPKAPQGSQGGRLESRKALKAQQGSQAGRPGTAIHRIYLILILVI